MEMFPRITALIEYYRGSSCRLKYKILHLTLEIRCRMGIQCTPSPHNRKIRPISLIKILSMKTTTRFLLIQSPL